MPVVNDPIHFRPARVHAKKPTVAQKLEALAAIESMDGTVTRKYPSVPRGIGRSPVAAAHFKNLTRQIHPDDFDNQILLDYISKAAQIWAKMDAVLEGLLNGTTPNTIASAPGTPILAPEFAVLKGYQSQYQQMLASAGIKGVNQMTAAGKARAKLARAGKVEVDPGAAQFPTSQPGDRGIMGLLARAKPA